MPIASDALSLVIAINRKIRQMATVGEIRKRETPTSVLSRRPTYRTDFRPLSEVAAAQQHCSPIVSELPDKRPRQDATDTLDHQ
jgi:hypothetical protein